MTPICIVAYTDYLTDARVMRQAESASRAGYSVDVITPGRRGQERTLVSHGVTVHRLRTSQYRGTRKAAYVLSYIAFFVLCLVRLSRLQVRRGFRVVQVCNMPDLLVFAAAFAKLAGARIALDIHDPMPLIAKAKFPGAAGRGLYPLLLWQERISAAFADRILTVNEPLKRDVLIADGIAEDKISVVANFPDEGIFRGRGPGSVILPLRMVYYGTVSARFGLDTVLTAIHGLRHRDRLLFKIIGQGDAAVPLRERIGELDLGQVIDFENTSYPLRRLPEILSGFHLGLVPYAPSPATDYMLPVKLMELLALGIPSITVPNAAIRYYLDDRLYFRYDARNAETLTQLLDRILEDPSLLLAKRDEILGQPARFLWETERSKYLDVLARLSN